MTARDQIHDAVRNALVKDGWTITADPYTIEHEDLRVYADLAAEREASAAGRLAADRGGQKIVVEIKSFVGPSPVHDLELALGQYQLYRSLLELSAPERALHLAVSESVYTSFLSRPAVQLVLRRSQVAVLVVDAVKQEVISWIS